MKHKQPKLRNLKPRTPDAALVAQIKKLRPHLSKPCPIRFFLYYSTKDNAIRSANDLRAMDFKVDVLSSIGKLKWLCLASKDMFPEITTHGILRGSMVELALKYGGEYDGWEAELAEESAGAA